MQSHTVVDLNTNQRETAQHSGHQHWSYQFLGPCWGTTNNPKHLQSFFCVCQHSLEKFWLFFSFFFFTLRNSVSAQHISVRSSLHRHKRLQSSLYCFWLFCCPIIRVDAKLICGPLTFLQSPFFSSFSRLCLLMSLCP